MQPQHQHEDAFADWKRSSNIAFTICLAHSRGLTVPMRNKWGIQALGVPSGLAFAMMSLWATFTHDDYMFIWILFWIVAQIARRWESVRLDRAGARIHSQYDGQCEAVRGFGSENAAKLYGEPILCGILGGVLYWLYTEAHLPVYGLPYYFLAGCFTLPFVEIVKQTIWRKRAQDVMDARLENEATMRDFRDKWGDS
jgi:hypothetical protein